jgi:hypothetical protein
VGGDAHPSQAPDGGGGVEDAGGAEVDDTGGVDVPTLDVGDGVAPASAGSQNVVRPPSDDRDP